MSNRVMQQALEALEYHVKQTRPIHRTSDAITALRAALADQEQEPVAWMDIDSDGQRLAVRQWSDGNREEVPLYTAPLQRKPLTEVDILRMWLDATLPERHTSEMILAFVRDIERAHGIGEQE